MYVHVQMYSYTNRPMHLNIDMHNCILEVCVHASVCKRSQHTCTHTHHHGRTVTARIGRAAGDVHTRRGLSIFDLLVLRPRCINVIARLAQSAERKALNLVVVGSSPTVGDLCGKLIYHMLNRTLELFL